jgi:hypothetical protein
VGGISYNTWHNLHSYDSNQLAHKQLRQVHAIVEIFICLKSFVSDADDIQFEFKSQEKAIHVFLFGYLCLFILRISPKTLPFRTLARKVAARFFYETPKHIHIVVPVYATTPLENLLKNSCQP